MPLLKFPFTLTIAGTGEPEYIKALKAMITDDNIAAKINWFGFVDEEKFDLISHHHLLILPSHDENFGNVVIESLSVGTPVLISNKVGLAGYVTGKKLGWVCKAEKNDLSDTLNQIEPGFNGELERIRETAPQLIRQDFNTDILIQQYIAFYKTLTE
ncbi:MAG: glycosyltransferase [Mucilaginibacter sp.]|nr:glycosyltransferase [Mucilaginibacter sp.]